MSKPRDNSYAFNRGLTQPQEASAAGKGGNPTGSGKEKPEHPHDKPPGQEKKEASIQPVKKTKKKAAKKK